MKNNVQKIRQTIHRNLNEISIETVTVLGPEAQKQSRDTRLRRIVSSKLQRAKEGTRFLY